MRPSQIAAIEERANYRFEDRALLRQALLHRSYAHENPGHPHNEPLEFLGDAVLGFLVAERIVRRRLDFDEGQMTRLRARLVNTRHLADLARGMGLGQLLFLGRGEENDGGREKNSLLADAFEALVGAIFLDGGVRAARSFINRYFAEDIDEPKGEGRRAHLDPKTELQELVQSKSRALPAYRVAGESGPDHERRYVIEVLVGDEVVGRGSGSSKKRAEQAAAARALEQLKESDAD